MRRENPRARRVAEQIQRELPALIRLELDDPKVGMVTLTDVEVAGDLAHAKVFFTVLDDGVAGGDVDATPAIVDANAAPADAALPGAVPRGASAGAERSSSRADSLAALQRAAGFLRARLGHRLLLRSVPQLHFSYDESVERGVRLSRLIDQAIERETQS